ncbi:MAG: L-threonylcarbamoyladenylate synthase [Vicingaceae bacterium]
MTLISKDIQKAATLLKGGKLVAIPTETVYGLAANIYDQEAVKTIFELKQRPLFNPLIVHIHSFEQLADLVEEVPEKAKALTEKFWPGPLSLILKKKSSVPNLITAGKDTVAIRMPKHPLLLELLQELPFPLAAPSANPFNAISPTNAQRVKAYFEGQLEMVLEGGSSDRGIESTIVGFEAEEAIVYRLGSLSVETLEKVVGKVRLANQAKNSPQAPGMLSKHYSPSTPMILVKEVKQAIVQHKSKKIAILGFQNKIEGIDEQHQQTLSSSGNLEEAAAKLYEALHKLDDLAVDIIIAERLPEQGLGNSINDRLERASASS